MNPVLDLEAIALPTGNAVQLRWNNPSDDDFGGVTVRRNTGDYPTGPTDGTLVYRGENNGVVDLGGQETDSETAEPVFLDNGTMYYYAAYAHDVPPVDYSTAAQVSVAPAFALTDASIKKAVDAKHLVWAFLQQQIKNWSADVRVVKAYPQEILEAKADDTKKLLPCIEIEHFGGTPEHVGLGEVMGETYDPYTDKWEFRRGAVFGDSIGITISALNSDRRDSLSRMVRAILIYIEEYLMVFGISLRAVTEGPDLMTPEPGGMPFILYEKVITLDITTEVEIAETYDKVESATVSFIPET